LKITDLELVAQASSGSNAATEALLLSYVGFIRSVVGGIGVSHSQREDVVQEVSLKIIEKIRTFSRGERTGSFRAWIRSICQKTIWEVQRQQVRHSHVGLTSLKCYADGNNSSRDLLTREIESWIQQLAFKQVFAQLSDDEAKIIHLRIVEQLDAASVAEKIGTSRHMVYKITSQFKRRVRELLED